MHTDRFKEYKIAALIVAAGIGSRCNGVISKQYIKLVGKPVLFHTVRKFLANRHIDYVRVVINQNHENFYKEAISSIIDTKLLSPVYGGKIRQNSVKFGLESLQKMNLDFVIIHDACRPFVSDTLIDNLAQFMVDGQHVGVVPAMEVESTMLVVDNGFIKSSISREKLREVQTPQIFDFKELLLCHQSNKEFTDDSSLMIGHKKCVAIIRGEKSNFKLTTKEDIGVANLLLEEPKYRVGTGYDIHKFVKAQNKAKSFIRVCGVEIEYDMVIEAHSDGDVAIHAIVDAILGALGCDDIGKYFPSSSVNWKDCNSSYFLSFAAAKAKERGYRVSNLDVTIVCEEPKISPYRAKMKKFISRVLGIDDEFVNVKTTTAEKLGSIGRSEGIAAHASVLLYKLVSYANFSLTLMALFLK
ncbi:2-C-methyl-D-erythritol 4-phosphate cytidylyltransferase [Wolbachia endosymbiont of Dirofilaria (Dirofilaria) immitis]|uniref:2-C-methyl-D-erythritol 4-phosphate cytidylyltransferase n=1 Tax=Wolbachia endosymbiont of Dirofilaria (Dirofilaria) immitis TaxID=1812115 RepID=UPI00158A1416|nr:2-C-methyl-D-erythritol 4-phosphate cytidylyltransferase [Wolbachia endosymbiont of Dirofilaria (Dirofilaria) immitis]QKX02607.1 2-C-methyl-D-erythritol 4-phosphate cytidylyltransferase [Wolbachia endosymbiont of Dirofilaria (Dirofilaria) immitis]